MSLYFITLCILLYVFLYIALSSEFGSLLSPYGMVGVVLCNILMIPEAFETGKLEGYIMVFFVIVFYCILIRSVQLYNKYSKD